jgi:hypothetical protein
VDVPRVKPNAIVGQFIPHRIDLIESVAWGGLSLAARRVLDRLEIEHMHHGGVENGHLPCTYSDLERFGVRRKSISAAIEELVAAGMIEVTHQGRGGNAVYRNASRYRLTYLATRTAAPTDEWKRRGRHPGAERKNAKPGAKTPPTQGAKTPPTEPITRGENAPTALGAKTPLLSISREDAATTPAAQPREQASPSKASGERTGQASGAVTVGEALASSPIVRKLRAARRGVA